jgi:hypothetical protein
MADIDGADTAPENQTHAGDQASRWHPVPAQLGTRQKVGNPDESPFDDLNPIEDARIGVQFTNKPQIVRD